MDAITTVPAPANEPVHSYAPGSPERERLIAALADVAAGLGAALGLAVATGCALAFSPDLRLGIYLIAPFGASSVLLFAAPNSPLAQPWAAIVGNTVAAVTAILVGRLVSGPLLCVPLSVGLAIVVMALCRATHPPGGAVAMTVAMGAERIAPLGLGFSLVPVAAGTALLVLVAVLYARATGRRVVWDFRSEDVRQGGEGAPLAPFFHHALARWAVGQARLEAAPVVFLNLGGVGNLTWCDPRRADPVGACVAFDTGPANVPLNDMMRARRGLARDEGGRLAAAGQVREGVIAAVLRHPYFARPAPKSLDRDSFAMLGPAVAQMDDADAAATLVHAAAAAVAAGLALVPQVPALVLVCGGGRHNGAMMAALERRLPCAVAGTRRKAPVPTVFLAASRSACTSPRSKSLGMHPWP